MQMQAAGTRAAPGKNRAENAADATPSGAGPSVDVVVAFVGGAVGGDVGFFVGIAVGIFEGICVGIFEGMCVGDLVGSNVAPCGNGVGIIVGGGVGAGVATEKLKSEAEESCFRMAAVISSSLGTVGVMLSSPLSVT
jgi:hypothetical protein